jgi:uncharacterized protein YjiS (DUF1127 family)
MSMQITDHPASSMGPQQGSDAARDRRFAGFPLRAWRAYRDWRSRRVAIRHLRQADEYLLRDIGIDRHEIAAAVSGSLQRQPAVPARALEPKPHAGPNVFAGGGRKAA